MQHCTLTSKKHVILRTKRSFRATKISDRELISRRCHQGRRGCEPQVNNVRASVNSTGKSHSEICPSSSHNSGHQIQPRLCESAAYSYILLNAATKIEVMSSISNPINLYSLTTHHHLLAEAYATSHSLILLEYIPILHQVWYLSSPPSPAHRHKSQMPTRTYTYVSRSVKLD